ncbi:hypothetical protein GCM10011504_51200 [Siccirubricoccus deserti]|uniref:DUF3489 domain-containing protein n=1 Tax=Siccirubricoccus deserti TaxID=2013562 RepID=A0A9X0R4X5_9PROT|nr:DUF3489 domain-containing protein [Siccirubricoccus deserti]GGC66974.1 hypothetical protein GCM10011504_51200 [Siccirubricoccus deserti]
MKLTDTQMAILTAAAHQPEHLAVPPERLPAAARQTVAKALLKNDLVIAVQRPAYDAQALWMVDGDSVLLKITDEGLRAIGMAPQGAAPATDAAPTGAPEAPTQANPAGTTEPAQAAPAAPDDATRAEDLALLDQALAAPGPKPRASLRDTAAAVLAAWEDATNRDIEMIGALEGTKQEQVLAMLRRPEGATVAQITDDAARGSVPAMAGCIGPRTSWATRPARPPPWSSAGSMASSALWPGTASAGPLLVAVEHFCKVARSYRPGLFHCPAITDMRNLLGGLFYLVRTGCPWRHLPPPRPSRLGPRCTAIGAPSCGTEAGRASAAARRSRWCLRGGWLKGHSAGSEDSDACRRTTRRCPRSPKQW